MVSSIHHGERNLRLLGIVLAVFVAIGLSACGTYVRELQDVWSGFTGPLLPYVNDIVDNIICEVRDAVRDLFTRVTQVTMRFHFWITGARK